MLISSWNHKQKQTQRATYLDTRKVKNIEWALSMVAPSSTPAPMIDASGVG